jgi:hypothetical protein
VGWTYFLYEETRNAPEILVLKSVGKLVPGRLKRRDIV